MFFSFRAGWLFFLLTSSPGSDFKKLAERAFYWFSAVWGTQETMSDSCLTSLKGNRLGVGLPTSRWKEERAVFKKGISVNGGSPGVSFGGCLIWTDLDYMEW